ncbi:hypothetical protein AXX17_AT4G35180 [Arabidopsis thaliana]|uniref:Uncharacterized protein n=1 Tax=Arabidopsis thaliana TaxID=3702 RepID=A0A178V332_ARATH|nr:hypothetical protein AXX17_AT4G35180 [Arabidopsis thaliana]
MQQGDSMLSLRPGGGRGGSRRFAPRFTLSSSSDLTNGGDAPSFAVKCRIASCGFDLDY